MQNVKLEVTFQEILVNSQEDIIEIASAILTPSRGYDVVELQCNLCNSNPVGKVRFIRISHNAGLCLSYP